MARLLHIALLLFAVATQASETVPAFSDVQAWLITGSAGKDLSGLAWCNGRLYANSDKVDDKLYAIDIRDDAATLTVARTLPPLPARTMFYAYPAGAIYWYDYLVGHDFIDWEDIQCRGDAIYLLSERKNGIAVIADATAPDGPIEWLPIDWYDTLHQAGYLNAYNAYGEGLAVIDPGHILIALERQPRGLADLRQQPDGRWMVTPIALDNNLQLEFRQGSEDVAALALHDGWLYTLERNASAVCRRDLKAFKTDSCFSYRSVEDDPRYRYRGEKYGLGEGLAIDAEFIYIVFDNNNAAREADERDRRGLLLKIKMPAAWR